MRAETSPLIRIWMSPLLETNGHRSLRVCSWIFNSAEYRCESVESYHSEATSQKAIASQVGCRSAFNCVFACLQQNFIPIHIAILLLPIVVPHWIYIVTHVLINVWYRRDECVCAAYMLSWWWVLVLLSIVLSCLGYLSCVIHFLSHKIYSYHTKRKLVLLQLVLECSNPLSVVICLHMAYSVPPLSLSL